MTSPLTLPDAAGAPSAIRRAVDARNTRAGELREAQRELREARLGVDAAITQDRSDYATARDRGRADPGPANERAARERLADSERREAGEALRLEQAERDLRAALAQHVDSWAESMGKVWKKADDESTAALAKFVEAEERRRRVRVTATWLASVVAGGRLDEPVRPIRNHTALGDAQNADAHLSVDVLLGALGEHLSETSVEQFEAMVAEGAERRQQSEELGRLRAHENDQVKAAAVMVGSGELDLEDAQRVAEGAALDEVVKWARERRAAARQAPVYG